MTRYIAADKQMAFSYGCLEDIHQFSLLSEKEELSWRESQVVAVSKDRKEIKQNPINGNANGLVKICSTC